MKTSDRKGLYRLPSRGWLSGVCAGIADRYYFDLTAIRIIVVVLTAGTGGLFGLIYLAAWAAMPIAADDVAEPAGSWGWRRRSEGGNEDAESPARRPRSGAIRLGLGVTLNTLGILLLFRELGLWWSDAVVWPIVIAAGGAALVLRQIQVSSSFSPPSPHRLKGVLTLYRGGFGIALILAATIAFLYSNGVFGEVSDAAIAVLSISAAIGLILAPFLFALARRAREERLQRIRSEERAELAAHLHDSVLQTLALIQRRAGDSPEIATLARRQERELREWLSGRRTAEREASLAAALENIAAELEEAHQVPVEVVTVGDRPLDRQGEALAAASREAITNAIRFGAEADGTGTGPAGSGVATAAGPNATGAAPVSVFAELADDRGSVFIRDRGPGFDPDSIPADRRGVRESIIGRMERHGGSATIRSRPGEGTEVELTMEFS